MVQVEIEHLPILRPKEILVETLAPGKAVVLRVAKQDVETTMYAFGKYVDGFAGGTSGQWSGLAPQNLLMPRLTALAANSFVANQRLAVAGISGVQDMLMVTKAGEAFQVFVGVAPRDIRYWLLQPNGQYVAGFGQNLSPLQGSQLVDFQKTDGYMSPIDRPSPKTEIIVLDGLDVAFTLVNMLTGPTRYPTFGLVVNRMILEPVTDPDEIAKALASKVGHRSIGPPYTDVSSNFTAETYGNPPIFDLDATLAEIADALKAQVKR